MPNWQDLFLRWLHYTRNAHVCLYAEMHRKSGLENVRILHPALLFLSFAQPPSFFSVPPCRFPHYFPFPAPFALIPFPLHPFLHHIVPKNVHPAGWTFSIGLVFHIVIVDKAACQYNIPFFSGHAGKLKGHSSFLALLDEGSRKRLPVPFQQGADTGDPQLITGLDYLNGIPQYISPGLGASPYYSYQPGRLFNSPAMTYLQLTSRIN